MRSSWFKLHNFDDNLEYTKKVLKKFNIDKYHFVTDMYGCLALIIDINLNTYRIDVDMDNCEMVIRKKRIKYKAKRHPVEKLEPVKKIDKDCIWESIKWIVKDGERP